MPSDSLLCGRRDRRWNERGRTGARLDQVVSGPGGGRLGRVVIERTIDELRETALEAGDAAGYFPALYARVTADMAARIRDGSFEDGERMERFATAFANC